MRGRGRAGLGILGRLRAHCRAERFHGAAPTLQGTIQGTVPYLGTFLTDLVMLDTAMKDYLYVSERGPLACPGSRTPGPLRLTAVRTRLCPVAAARDTPEFSMWGTASPVPCKETPPSWADLFTLGQDLGP